MKYPAAAPLLLSGAGVSIIAGTLRPHLAWFAFSFGAPCCFLSLNVVLLLAAGRLSLPSALLFTGNILTLANSACNATHATNMICSGVIAVPPLVRAVLAFSGPAILTMRIGPNPVFVTWLGSTAIPLAAMLMPDVLDGYRPGLVSGALILLCSAFMVRSPPATLPTNAPLCSYARVWAAHTMLQLQAQPFLFPDGTRLPLRLAVCALALLPSPGSISSVLMLRNAARLAAMPFVWDSEFWLALTDASVLAALYSTRSTAVENDGLPHVGCWARRQLAICYAAAGFFKLNTAFLDPTVSCAPIFGLSLLERAPPVASWLGTQPMLLRAFASAMPYAVVGTELLIALMLSIERHAPNGVMLALLFHLGIAITPPPNGVPTFSCVAASRLLLCIGDDAQPIARALADVARVPTAVLVTLAAVLAATRSYLDAAITLFLLLMAINLLALRHHHQAPRTSTRTTNTRKSRRVVGTLLTAAAALYAFGLPIIGLQEIGSCTMFANMRLVQGASNHRLGVPTGLMQSWLADEPTATYGGGVVRVESTSSAFVHTLYPGEITTLLQPHTRELLHAVGHATRQFNPKARRVLGASIRERMPRWHAKSGTPFVRFTVPALELRRVLMEARAAAAASKTRFDLRYTRLVAGADSGGEEWRAHSRGVSVKITGDDGKGNGRCVSRDDTRRSRALLSSAWRAVGGGWMACGAEELAMLPAPSALALKLSLYYPLAIVPGVSEVVCNY